MELFLSCFLLVSGIHSFPQDRNGTLIKPVINTTEEPFPTAGQEPESENAYDSDYGDFGSGFAIKDVFDPGFSEDGVQGIRIIHEWLHDIELPINGNVEGVTVIEDEGSGGDVEIETTTEIDGGAEELLEELLRIREADVPEIAEDGANKDAENEDAGNESAGKNKDADNGIAEENEGAENGSAGKNKDAENSSAEENKDAENGNAGKNKAAENVSSWENKDAENSIAEENKDAENGIAEENEDAENGNADSNEKINNYDVAKNKDEKKNESAKQNEDAKPTLGRKQNEDAKPTLGRITGRIEDESGNICLDVNMSAKININHTVIIVPPDATVTGNCTGPTINIRIAWTSPSGNHENYIRVAMENSKENKKRIGYVKMRVYDESKQKHTSHENDGVAFPGNVTLEFSDLGGSGEAADVAASDPTLVAVQISLGVACFLLVVAVAGYFAYKRLGGEKRTFKVDLNK